MNDNGCREGNKRSSDAMGVEGEEQQSRKRPLNREYVNEEVILRQQQCIRENRSATVMPWSPSTEKDTLIILGLYPAAKENTKSATELEILKHFPSCLG